MESHGSARLVPPLSAGLIPAGQGMGWPVGTMRGPRRWWRATDDVPLALPTWPAGQNLLVLGPPRAGKGASQIIPALLGAADQPGPVPSVVVTDPKGELLAATAGYLAERGYGIWVLHWPNPAISDAYDALSWIADGAGGVVDYGRVAELAAVMVPMSGAERDPFWGQAARLIISAAAVLAVHVGGTLADALALAYAAASDPEALLDLAERTDAWAAAQLRILVAALAAHPQLRASITVDLPARYQSWTLPPVLAVVHQPRPGEAAWRWERLWDPDGPPAVLYIIGGPEQAAQLAYAWAHAMSALLATQRAVGRLPRPVLLVMDEFGNVGKIPNILSALNVLPGAGVSTVLSLQSTSQLRTVYSAAESDSILAAAHAVIALPGLDPESAEWVSRQLGYGTESSVSRSVDAVSGHDTYQVSHHQRRVLYPDEVQSLHADHILVHRLGWQPTLVRARRYYAVPAWAGPAAIGDPAHPLIADVLAANRRAPLEPPDLARRAAVLLRPAAPTEPAGDPAETSPRAVEPLDLAALLRDDA